MLIDGQSNAVACDYHGELVADLEANTFVRTHGSSVPGGDVVNDQSFDQAVAQVCGAHGAIL